MIVTQDQGFPSNRLKLSDKHFNKGDLLLGFDILLGDALFVDRFSYNFVHPKSGDPAVLGLARSMNLIERLELELSVRSGKTNTASKRLVGEPGDVLQMKVPKYFHQWHRCS